MSDILSVQELRRLGVGPGEIAVALESIFGDESESLNIRQHVRKDYADLGEHMQGRPVDLLRRGKEGEVASAFEG